MPKLIVPIRKRLEEFAAKGCIVVPVDRDYASLLLERIAAVRKLDEFGHCVSATFLADETQNWYWVTMLEYDGAKRANLLKPKGIAGIHAIVNQIDQDRAVVVPDGFQFAFERSYGDYLAYDNRINMHVEWMEASKESVRFAGYVHPIDFELDTIDVHESTIAMIARGQLELGIPVPFVAASDSMFGLMHR
jgi:hypothetical protein